MDKNTATKRPKSTKMMERKTLELLAKSQLKQIAHDLNGRLITTVGKDQDGNTWRTITIEYPDGGFSLGGK